MIPSNKVESWNEVVTLVNSECRERNKHDRECRERNGKGRERESKKKDNEKAVEFPQPVTFGRESNGGDEMRHSHVIISSHCSVRCWVDKDDDEDIILDTHVHHFMHKFHYWHKITSAKSSAEKYMLASNTYRRSLDWSVRQNLTRRDAQSIDRSGSVRQSRQ